MSDYEEGYRQGLEASRHYQEEAKAYKEAYMKLLESIASMKAFDLPPPIFIQAQPVAQPRIVATKTWFENGELITKNLTEDEFYLKPKEPTWNEDEGKNQMLLEALKELLAVHTGPKINCETQSYKAVVKARAAIEQAERTTP